MIKNLFLQTKALFLMAFLLLSTAVLGQTTLIEYNFNTPATWNTPNVLDAGVQGPAPTLKYWRPNGAGRTELTPGFANGRLRALQENDYVELTINTTGYSSLNLSFDLRLEGSGLVAVGTWSVQYDRGAGFQPNGSVSGLTSIFGQTDNETYNRALPGDYFTVNPLIIRITATDWNFLGGSTLFMDNLKITYSSPNITVYNSNVPIPDNSDASATYNTIFGNRLTFTEPEDKTYRIRNYRGPDGSVLNVSSIEIEPTTGTTANDFTVAATSNITGLGSVGDHNSSTFGTFTIRFNPQGEGLRSAIVRVYSNGVPNPYSFTVQGEGRSCNIEQSPYVINTVDLGTQTLPSDLSAADLVGGTANNPTPQILGTTTIYPNGPTNLYTSSPASWYTTTTTAKTRTFGGDAGINISQLKQVSVEFNVAAFSRNNSGGNNTTGVTTNDYIRLEVFVGGTWRNVMQLNGSNSSANSNRRKYAFNPTGKVFESTYNGNLAIVSNEGINTATDGNAYARFKLNLPAAVVSGQNQFKFRITAKANADAAWLIDDVRITSDNARRVTWTGSNWQRWNGSTYTTNNIRPSDVEKAVFAGNYNFTVLETSDLTVCGCEVNEEVTFTIPSPRTLTVKGAVINHGDGSNFIIRNGGNLIQQENAAINEGNITVENTFIFSSGRQQYNYVISPVVDQNIRQIYPGNPPALYHAESTNYFYSSTGAYIAGRGLALKEPAGTGTATVTGKYVGVPFNGILDYGITYSAPKPNYTPGWNLIGNPYPSNLDLVLFYNSGGNNSKISPTFKFWDNRNNTIYSQQGSGYSGPSYATFNVTSGSGGTGTAASGSRIPTRYVKPGLAFMTQALSTANGQTIHFNNDYRAKGTAVDFHGKPGEEVEDDRFWLMLTSPTGVEMTAAVVYFANGNNDYAPDDSDYANVSDEIYTILGDHKLIIQGKAPFEDTDVLPIGINTFRNGAYKIGIYEKEGKFAGDQPIYLKDKVTGILTDLTLGDYTFDVQAGVTDARFEIVYKSGLVLATDASTSTAFQIYRDGQDFVVKSGEELQAIEIYDMAGRMLFSATPKNREYRFNAAYLNSGVYVVRALTATGIKVKRILK